MSLLEEKLLQRKKMTAHSWKSRFQRQRAQGNETETLSAKSENCGLLETHVTISKGKRMSCSAHEEEPSSCDATTFMEIDGSSASKKLASKGEGTEDEANDDIMEIRRPCNKRMKKLTREQQRHLQDREEEKLRLENDHKLEAAIIRSVFSEGSIRADKLKLLESEFKKKMEKLNTQLKDKELQYQSAMNVERRKIAQRLAAIKALCSIEQTAAVCGAKSLGSQSMEDGECAPASQPKEDDKCSPANQPKKDGECSPASEPKEDGEAMDAYVTTQHMVVNQSNKAMSMQGNGVEPFDQSKEDGKCSPTSEPKEDGEYSPARQHIVEAMDVDVTTQHMAVNDSNKVVSMQGNEVEPFDQTENLNPGEIVCSKLPASEERVCDKMQPVESNEGIPLDVHEIVDNVNPMELSNGPNKQDVTVFADSSENQGGNCNEPNTADSPVAGQRESVMNHCGSFSLTLQVSEDQVHQNLVSANPQENSAPDLDRQSTLQTEVANCELDSTGTHVHPHIKGQRIENCEQLCLLPIHASPSCDLSAATEAECQTRDSGSLTAEAVEILVLPPEPLVCANVQHGNLPQDTPQIEVANLEPDTTGHYMQPHAEEHGSENCEQQHLVSADASSSCNPTPATDVEHQTHDSGRNLSQAAEAMQAFVLPLESSPQILGNNTLWLKSPLENELERLHKETQRFEQSCKDMTLHLKSECEKEIQEMVAQIRSKFDVKLKDAETEFRLKKNEFDKKCEKVLLNKMLADALNTPRAQCSSGFPGMQQGILSSHHHQPSIQHPLRHAARPDILQQPLVPHPAPPVPAEQYAVRLPHGSSSRPLIITSARIPYMKWANLSPAPHLQTLRTTAASAMSPPFPGQLAPPFPGQLAPPYTLGNGLAAFHYQPISAPNVVADINRQLRMHRYGTTPTLPEVSSTFGSLDPSLWDTLNSVPPSSGSSSDIICLVDDD